MTDFEKEILRGSEPLHQFFEELTKAGYRLGRTKADAMKRLLQFCGSDLESLSIGDRNNLYFELAYFSVFGARGSQPVSPFSLLIYGTTRHEARWATKAFGSYTIPNLNEATKLQQDARKIIDELIEEGSTSIRLPASEFELGKDPKRRVGYLRVVHDHPRNAFLYHFIPLVFALATWIKRCKRDGCTRRYLAVRQKQLYCSLRCQSRIATQRYRKKRGHH